MDDENTNEDSVVDEQNVQETNEQSLVNQGTQKVANTGVDKLKKKVTEKASKEVKNAAVKKGAMMALSHILVYVIAFLITVIVLTGMAMLFVIVPGMIMDKLKSLGKAIGSAWASWFGEDETKTVEREQVYAVMDYVEEMGYNLKEHGFLTHYLDEDNLSAKDGRVYMDIERDYSDNGDVTDEDCEDELTPSNKDVFDPENDTAKLDEEQGVYRSENSGKIVAGCSDFIMQYIISDNYMYTIRNFNVVSGSWWGAVFEHLKGLFSDDMSNRRGMILLLHDSGVIGMADTSSYRNR